MANDINERKASIMAKAHAEILKAETECSIIESLPIAPSIVHVYSLYGRVGSAKYNATSKEHAVEIFEAFKDKLPSYSCKSGSMLSIKAIDDEKSDEVQELLFSVHIEKWDQSVNFYVQTQAGIVEIEISMGFCPFGQYYIADKHRTKHYRWEFRAENRLLGLLRVANYARTEQTGDNSAPHMIYAGFEDFEFYDAMGVDRK